MKSFAGRTIKVTKEHIKKGKRFKTNACPIALAVKAIAKGKYVSVGPSWVHIGKESFYMPKNGKKFIERFDSGILYPQKPITIKLSKAYSLGDAEDCVESSY